MEMIDKKLHEQTTYRIPYLRRQIKKSIDRVGSFIIDCNEYNWDGYDGKLITVNTIKLSAEVLNYIGDWFEKNISFLNNRSFNISTAPMSSGEIHIEINYDNLFECDFIVKHGLDIECDFHALPRFELNGKKTIADRNFKMLFPEDIIHKTCPMKKIGKFLDEAFYKHKWKF